jgi:hypothetical protein
MDENTTKDLPLSADVRLKRPGLFVDLTGKKFGFLTVLGLAERSIKNTKGFVKWRCLCDCGKESFPRTEHLTSGRVIACGCKRPRPGHRNPAWKGCGEFPGHYFCHIKNRARAAGRDFDLTPEYLWQLYLDQDGRCAFSGMEIAFKPQKQGRSTASLDRIFSSGGYTIGNVQWLHKDINLMKNVFRQEQFFDYCCMVVDFSQEKYEKKLSLSSVV